MGIYNDFRNTNREGWKYHYTGAFILHAAKKKYSELWRREMAARQVVSDLLRDPKVSPNDDRLLQGKKDIDRYGNEREQCQVYIHEFSRTKEREFILSLGDVTYFDLAPDLGDGSDD